MKPAVYIPSFVIVKIQNLIKTSPSVKNKLNTTLNNNSKKIVFSPFSINFKGTLEILITLAKKIVATIYPVKLLNKNKEIKNTIVPANFTLGSNL